MHLLVRAMKGISWQVEETLGDLLLSIQLHEELLASPPFRNRRTESAALQDVRRKSAAGDILWHLHREQERRHMP